MQGGPGHLIVSADEAELKLARKHFRQKATVLQKEVIDIRKARRGRKPSGAPEALGAVLGGISSKEVRAAYETMRLKMNNGECAPPWAFEQLLEGVIKNGKLNVEDADTLFQEWVLTALAQDFLQHIEVVSRLLSYYEGTFAPDRINIRARLHVEIEIERRRGDEEERILRAAQSRIRNQEKPAWVLDFRKGLMVTAPSETMCKLLGVSRESLEGTQLIDRLLMGAMYWRLTNYSEALLSTSMLVDSWLLRCHERGIIEFDDKARVYFDEVKNYVLHNLQKIHAEIMALPRGEHLQYEQETLRECLLAALGRSERWPAFDPQYWTRGRVYVRTPDGGVARFIKTARPIPQSGDPIGLEVMWDPEDLDDTTIAYLRSLRR